MSEEPKQTGNRGHAPHRVAYGQAMREHRQQAGMSQEQLASRLGVSHHIIERLESEGRLPSGGLPGLHEALGLTKAQEHYLIDLMVGRSLPQVQESAQSLASLVEDLAGTVKSLSTQVSQQDSNFAASLVPIIQKLEEKSAEASQASNELTARLDVPKDMVIKMVPVSEIARLEEHRNDQTRWSTWFGVFIGSILGILINIATGDPLTITKAALLMLIFFVALGVVTWNFEKTAEKRGNELIARLLNSQARERGE